MNEGADVRLYDALVAADAAAAIAVVDEVRGGGAAQAELFDTLFAPALAMLGAAWADGRLDEVAFAQSAVVAEQIASFVTPPALAADTGVSIVVGCAPGDTHDVLKNVIAGALKEAGHRVMDLGVDVRPHEFAAKLVETGARLAIVFAQTMATAGSVRRIRDVFENESIDDTVLLVAGGPFEADPRLVREVGANGLVRSAEGGLRMVATVARERLGLPDVGSASLGTGGAG